MLYRRPAPSGPRPASPDVDPRLFAPQPWRVLLVVTLVYGPLLSWCVWFDGVTVRFAGTRVPLGLDGKLVATGVVAAWLVGLLVSRAMWRRRERATLRALTANDANLTRR